MRSPIRTSPSVPTAASMLTGSPGTDNTPRSFSTGDRPFRQLNLRRVATVLLRLRRVAGHLEHVLHEMHR